MNISDFRLILLDHITYIIYQEHELNRVPYKKELIDL